MNSIKFTYREEDSVVLYSHLKQLLMTHMLTVKFQYKN